jgi:hypothetical protein
MEPYSLIMDALTSAEVTAWATVVLGIGTLGLASVALWQANLTRKAVNSANQEVREATKARVDARAPTVTVEVVASAAMTNAWMVEMERNQRYFLSQHRQMTVGLTGWFRIRSAGPTVANVWVPEGVLLLSSEHPIVSLNDLAQYARPGPSMLPLPPGGDMLLVVDARRTIAEWADLLSRGGKPTLTVPVVVEDTFSDGIRDETDLTLTGDPLVRGATDDEWITNPGIVEVGVGRTVREYQRES